MTVNIKQLNGKKLKNALNARRVAKRWHNKNNSGGNFGINIYYEDQFTRGVDKEITGYHNKEGEVYSLSFGDLWGVGSQIIRRETYKNWTYDKLIKFLRLNRMKGEKEADIFMFKVNEGFI